MSYIFDVKCNKDLADKRDELDAEVLVTRRNCSIFKNLCKHKKELNKCSDDDLLCFRETLPKNVLLEDLVSSSRKFKKHTGFADGTARIIGPCIDIDCSGRDRDGKPVYRVFNSQFDMKKHGTR